jgi:hypothetical protein
MIEDDGGGAIVVPLRAGVFGSQDVGMEKTSVKLVFSPFVIPSLSRDQFSRPFFRSAELIFPHVCATSLRSAQDDGILKERL